MQSPKVTEISSSLYFSHTSHLASNSPLPDFNEKQIYYVLSLSKRNRFKFVRTFSSKFKSYFAQSLPTGAHETQHVEERETFLE